MTTIIGVDYSGARNETKTDTWVAQARLDSSGVLRFNSVQPALRNDLYKLLASVPTPAFVAMDFPFGVPSEFAAHIALPHSALDMPGLWDAVAAMGSIEDFVNARNNFVAVHGEPKRAGDLKYHPESKSPLHRVQPDMVPMTYHGIQMLQHLHMDIPNRWLVPPLESAVTPADAVTLLELMPGAFLKSISLRNTSYKSGRRYLEHRTTILNGLSDKSGIPLPNLESVRMACRANDDCLDAVVAAVGAAAWALYPSRFRHPTADELANARLEGWIYVPKKLPSA